MGFRSVLARHNLLCRSTAFVAWDEAEKGVIATEHLHQPSRWPDHGTLTFNACMIQRSVRQDPDERVEPDLSVARQSELAEAAPRADIASARFLMYLRAIVADILSPQGWSELMDALEEKVNALIDPVDQIALCREFVQKQIEASELQTELLAYLKKWEEEVRVA